MPENTSKTDPKVLLADALVRGPSESIEASEAAGQAQLVREAEGEWATVPARIASGYGEQTAEDFERYEALGFEFHPEDKALILAGKEGELDDELFMRARLPEGWRMDATGHSMWSHIYDAEGFCRIGVFYKAAFYDRGAHMSIDRVPKTDAQSDAISALRESDKKYGEPGYLVLQEDEALDDGTVRATWTHTEEDRRNEIGRITDISPDGSVTEVELDA